MHLKKFLNYSLFYVCVWVPEHTYGSQGNLQELILPFYEVYPEQSKSGCLVWHQVSLLAESSWWLIFPIFISSKLAAQVSLLVIVK